MQVSNQRLGFWSSNIVNRKARNNLVVDGKKDRGLRC